MRHNRIYVDLYQSLGVAMWIVNSSLCKSSKPRVAQYLLYIRIHNANLTKEKIGFPMYVITDDSAMRNSSDIDVSD